MIAIVLVFVGSNAFAQEDLRNVSIILSVIPDNYPTQKSLLSTGYIGVSNNEGQGIFAPSDMEVELKSSNTEIIKVSPRAVIKENEPFANFNLILSGQEGTSEITAIFQDQTITQTVSVGAVSGDVPVDVELVIMFPTENANINSKIPFSVFLRTVNGPALQAPVDVVVKLETQRNLLKLENNQLTIKKGNYYTLGEIKTKDITGTAFIKASVSELGKNAIESLKISSNVPTNLIMYVHPQVILEESETDFGIFVGLYDEFGNPVKATEDVKLSLSANRGNFLTDILDDHVKDSRSVIKKNNHALFFEIDSDQVFATTNPFNYTIAVSSDNYGSSSELLRIVDRPDSTQLKEHENKGVLVFVPPVLPTNSAAVVTYQASLIQDLGDDDDEDTDDDEEITKVLYADFEDGEYFPGQIERIYAAISNNFNASVDNLRVASNNREILTIEEIGIIEADRGFGFATIKTGQKTGTVDINIDIKGWGFGMNSTEIINPIKPASTKIFSPTGEGKIFFNNEGILELVIVTLDPEERGTSVDDGIHYIVTPANDVVSIPSDSTYGIVEINVDMFGNELKQTKDRKQIVRALALLEDEESEALVENKARIERLQEELDLLESGGIQDIDEIVTMAPINALSVGTPQRPELDKAQMFTIEPSPNTITVSLPFSHIASRGITAEYNIGFLHITDHFGNSIPVARDIQIDLDSSNPNIIEVPELVLLPKGESFVEFPITTKGIDGTATIHAESTGIKFDSDFDVTTSIYTTRLSLFVTPLDDSQVEIGKQYQISAFVDDEFGEAIEEANVFFAGTNLEFFPAEVTTDQFGSVTVLMEVNNEIPDVFPSVDVFADKSGYVEDSTFVEFQLKVDVIKDETILGIPPMILMVIIIGVAGGAGALAFFFLRKSKTTEEQQEADLEDEELI